MISRLFRCATPRQMTSFSWEKQYFSYCFEKQQQLEKHQKSQYKTVFLAYSRDIFFQDFALFSLHDTSTTSITIGKPQQISLDKTIFSKYSREIYVYDFTSFSLRDTSTNDQFFLGKQYFSYCFEKQQQLEKHQKSQYKTVFLTYSRDIFFQDFALFSLHETSKTSITTGKPQQISLDKTIFSKYSREIYVYDFTSFSLHDTSTNDQFSWEKQYFSYWFEKQQQLEKHQKSQYKTVFLAYSRDIFFQDFALFSLHDTSRTSITTGKPQQISLDKNHFLEVFS